MAITPHWRERGLCREYDPEYFFNPDTEFVATQVCNPCPVKHECLAWAIEHKVQFGVWGGLTEGQRRKATTKRQRVKCPSCASEDVEQLRNRHEGCLRCGLTWPV